MKRYLFHASLVAFFFGVGVGTIGHIAMPTIAWLGLVSFGLMVIWRRRSFASPAPVIYASSILLACFAVGLLRIETASWQFGHSILESKVGEDVEMVGVVEREPDVRENTTHLFVRSGSDVVLVTTDRHTAVAYGDEVFVSGTLKKPESFTSELGRTFNYPAYLLARGVEYQVSFAGIETLSQGNGYLIVSKLLAIKSALLEGIESALTEPQAGLGEGLLLGVKQALGEELEAAFRTSGIIHIVVLSGYNVMLVVTFIMFILSLFLPRRARLMIGIGAVACFALLVGLSATVVRASVMAGLLLFAQFLGRTYDLPRALLFAGAVMVFHNPYLLMYDIGFQFSFMATLGLILIAPQFETFISDGFSKLNLKEFLVATIATQIAVLPLLLYHIGEVSLVAVVVNLLVLPVVPLAMLATFLAGVGALFSSVVALPFSVLAHVVLTYIIQVAVFFSSLPFASVTVPPFPAYGVAVLYLGIGCIFLKLYKREVMVEAAGHSLDDWTIEEEPEKAEETLRVSSAPSDTPIFFR